MADPDDALLWTHRPIPQVHQPRPSELIWTLTNGDKRIDARLVMRGEYGVEVQLCRDGGFYGGKPGWRLCVHCSHNRTDAVRAYVLDSALRWWD